MTSVVSRNFVLAFLALQLLWSISWCYVITTPRKWTTHENNQVCVTLPSPATGNDFVNVSILQESSSQHLIPAKILRLLKGKTSVCDEIPLGEVTANRGKLVVEGELGGTSVNHNITVSIISSGNSIFIQTDKYLYKPSQDVQFRVLSVEGPYLKVSQEQYEEIWVENPSKTRIAQWLNVTNEKGLIHMSFQLTEEPEEGTYKIRAKHAGQKSFSTEFKVEEYVLPRFEVTLKPPKYILGTSKSFDFEVCAKYTFGQPVKGNLTLSVSNYGWGNYLKIYEIIDYISGCKTITYYSEKVGINDYKRHMHKLGATATVTESGTGVVIESKEVSVPITRKAISFEDLSPQEYMKPGLPTLFEIQATFPDGLPAVNEKMKVCGRNDVCKNYETNSKGILKFASSPSFTYIKIEAVDYPQIRTNNSYRSVMYASTFSITKKSYTSPSSSSLSIVFDEEILQCSSLEDSVNVQLPVLFASNKESSANITTQVISRGQIQFSKTFTQSLKGGNSMFIKDDLFLEPMKENSPNVTTGSFLITLNLPKTISPKAQVIIWYTRKDGEVVADARVLDVTKCLLNDVNLSWSSTLSEPSEQTNLTLEAEPNSLCSLGVVDKSVHLLSNKNSLTVDALLKITEKFSVSENAHDYIRQINEYQEYCSRKLEEEGSTTTPTSSDSRLPRLPVGFNGFGISNDISPLHMFDKAGLYVFSDQTIETRSCHRRPYYVPVFDIPIVQHSIKPSFMALGGVFKRKGAENAGLPVDSQKNIDERHPEDETEKRTYFPETWLWDLFTIADSGVSEKSLTLPDTVTEWVGSAVCVHPTKGVGVSAPASITTFRDFFVELTLPPSVKRGEILPVKISIFNYLKQPLPIHVVVEESEAYEFVEESNENLPAGEREGCVPAEDKVVLTVKILLRDVGQINITASANVNSNNVDTCGGSTIPKERSDVLIKPVRVEIEGFLKEEVKSDYICIDDSTNGEATMNWTLTLPSEIIPDSARGFVSVVGDLMGPTLENLGHLIRMPYGCGEQNMINFAPNIFVMQYLESSGQTDSAVTKNAIKFMEKGYQRELNYRHDDGSYSAFGKRDDSGSTWLTAFVLKNFAQARQFISVDSEDLRVSKDWLKKRQFENGCFESVGRVIHKEMKGGLSQSASPSLLSSFVVISLLEAGEDRSSRVVTDALFCLKADESTNDDPYSLAVKTYALTLAGHPESEKYLKSLLSMATKTTSTTFWELKPPHKLSKSVQVETAGYALLSILSFGSGNSLDTYLQEITKIVKWINGQRNGQGGFASTQDTIVALQALAEFEKVFKEGPIDLTVIVSGQNLESQFSVNDNNKLLQQRAPLTTFPATVTFDVVGEGCALIQTVLRYNIPNPEWSRAFNISVEVEEEAKGGCKTKRITTCASYLLEDKVSNMAIIEVDLVSGYIPDKGDLKNLVKDKIAKRYEVDGSLVTFYVDEFSDEDTCVSFKILREVDVENAKPGSVKVYDYYKPEYFVTEKYEIPSVECRTTLEAA